MWVERLGQVGLEVFGVLQADRQPYDVRAWPGIGRHRPVRQRGGVLDEGGDAAERDGMLKQPD